MEFMSHQVVDMIHSKDEDPFDPEFLNICVDIDG